MFDDEFSVHNAFHDYIVEYLESEEFATYGTIYRALKAKFKYSQNVTQMYMGLVFNALTAEGKLHRDADKDYSLT